MRVLSGEVTEKYLKNIIHAETQAGARGFDLTVKRIYDVKNRGEIDFGGSEREDCKKEEIEPEKRNENDDYGWWKLEPGTYIMEYNEGLKKTKKALLQPHSRLTRNSATHPTKLVSELEITPLHVGGKGINIKENSRVSKVLILE